FPNRKTVATFAGNALAAKAPGHGGGKDGNEQQDAGLQMKKAAAGRDFTGGWRIGRVGIGGSKPAADGHGGRNGEEAHDEEGRHFAPEGVIAPIIAFVYGAEKHAQHANDNNEPGD